MRALLLALLLALGATGALGADYDDCMQSDDLDQKIAGCTKVIENKKTAPGRKSFSLLHRGYAYRLRAKADLAFADIEEVLRMTPGSGRGHYERGMLYLEGEDSFAAVRDFDIAARRMSDKAFVWHARGRTNSNLGNYWQALQDFGEAVRLDPDYAQAFGARATVQCKIARPDAALSDWAEMLRLNPKLVSSERLWLINQGFLSDSPSENRDEEFRTAQRAYARAGCPGR